MKRTVLSLLLFVVSGLAGMAPPVLAQDAGQYPQPPLRGYYTYGTLRGVTTEEAMRGAAAATSIPMWSYSVPVGRDGSPHTGVMVGRSPFFHGARTTNIEAVIIPVKFTMTDHETGASVFDPTAADPTCSPHGSALTVFQNSPILKAADFTMPFSGGVHVGSGQYIDEFQRANFWQNVSVTGDRYHTVLFPVTALPVQSVTVPTLHGKGYKSSDFGPGFCGNLGGLDGSWWDPVIFTGVGSGEAQTLISALTGAGSIKPTQFPIFLFYNVVMNATGELACPTGCALGYHNSQGSPTQTYSVSDWDTTGLFRSAGNSSVMSHEVGEWMNDPLGNNLVGSWGSVGQVSQCEPAAFANLEVGDPLSGTLVPLVALNGMNYDLQELAFFSWFLGSPSLGVNGDFSNNSTFLGDAKLCPPGGTN
jgi:hypothetical protein